MGKRMDEDLQHSGKARQPVPFVADQLVPMIYDELRRLAAQQLIGERPGQTLDATALVHEAYLRLAGGQQFENRRHFFAAAAESMRRILVEWARGRRSLKRGGDLGRVDLDAAIAADPSGLAAPDRDDELLALDMALDRLADVEPQGAELVRLRYFAGFTLEESASLLDMSLRSVNRLWAYSKSWLLRELDAD
jgi:RNA polymerase sigma factor (TIGR02999 family)